MKNVGLLLIASVAFGCATQKYGFRPTGPVATAEAGFPASHYGVPPDAPKGEVYVTSFGTRDMDAGGGATAQLIHVRLAVSNQAGESGWSVDPAQQMLVAAGAAPQRPDFMEIDGRQDGNTTIGAGKRRVFDLYYRLPGGARDASALPAFELQWQINAGGRAVADRTTFAREPFRDYSEPSRSRVAVGVAVGGPWWAYGYGPGWWGWGHPYYGYGYGPYFGVGLGYGYGYGYYGGYRGRYGGGYYGGGGGPRYGGGGYGRGGGGGGGMIRAPTVRGRPGR